MRQLNGVYTQQFNRLHRRGGHVFQGRYKAIFIDKDSYLLELARYIVLNPVRAGMVSLAQEWPWSSFRARFGRQRKPSWLQVDGLLSAFGSKTSDAIECYLEFVIDGMELPSVWADLKNQIYLGDERFIDKMLSLVDGNKDLSEIPRLQARPMPKQLTEYMRPGKDRNTAIAQAYQSGGYTLKEIAEFFNLHYSTISVIVKSSISKT